MKAFNFYFLKELIIDQRARVRGRCSPSHCTVNNLVSEHCRFGSFAGRMGFRDRVRDKSISKYFNKFWNFDPLNCSLVIS